MIIYTSTNLAFVGVNYNKLLAYSRRGEQLSEHQRKRAIGEV